MQLAPDACYRALRAHDSRFDGLFFVGVATTGIYCRPVCPARTPRLENCSFFGTAAGAEAAGFRPCLRCRPELAPGNASVDAPSRLAAEALGRIEDGFLSDAGLADLAADLGVTDRHLRRVLRHELGVTPAQVAQTHRLLLAKRLLVDTDLKIIEVAHASGFASLRRFNALFRARYRLAPRDLRRGRAAGEGSARDSVLVSRLRYRPPFDWPALLDFLVRRAVPGVESVVGGSYLRTAAIGDCRGWFAVSHDAPAGLLRVEVAPGLAGALVPLLARVKRLCDLAADPLPIASRLGPLAAAAPGLRVPGAFDPFEQALRAVLGQQVGLRAAATLASRLAARFGEVVATPHAALDRLMPAAGRVAELTPAQLQSIGLTAARARALRALAVAVASGRLALDGRRPVEETIGRLREIPGIGAWTAQYIAMRALGWPDAFPAGDLGIRKALGGVGEAEALRRAEAWRPWRAYAVMHLWKSLAHAHVADRRENLE